MHHPHIPEDPNDAGYVTLNEMPDDNIAAFTGTLYEHVGLESAFLLKRSEPTGRKALPALTISIQCKALTPQHECSASGVLPDKAVVRFTTPTAQNLLNILTSLARHVMLRTLLSLIEIPSRLLAAIAP